MSQLIHYLSTLSPLQIAGLVVVIAGVLVILSTFFDSLQWFKSLRLSPKLTLPVGSILIIMGLLLLILYPNKVNNTSTDSSTTLSPTPSLTATAPILATQTPTSISPTTSLVQNLRSSTNTDSNTVKFKNTVTKGDLIIVALTQYERNIQSISDNQNDSFTKVGGTVANTQDGQDDVEMYYAKNVNGGPTQIMVSFGPPIDSDGGDTNIGIYEFSGLNSTSPLDDSAVNAFSNSKSEAESVRLLNTTEANEICFAVGVDSGPQDNSASPNTTITQGSGYSFPPDIDGQTDRQADAQNGERYYTEYAGVTAGGCKPNFAIAYPSYWAMVGASFKP